MPIEIKDLNYVYSPGSPFEKAALKNINLTVPDGDFLAVIGHTGSGKSTLISHLNALTRVQSGSVVVNGIDLTPKKIDFKKLRSTVGMVFQYPEYQLFDETVAKDIGFGPRNLKLEETQIKERVREAMDMVGLDFNAYSERSPFELSGGQKRRVALAGVLAMRPQILVLDEPTAGLDPRGKKDILDLIKAVQKKMCPTIIMISHNMDEVAAYADRIAVMANGEIKAVLTPRELFGERELMKSLGIAMPFVTQAANKLADAGLDIPRSCLTEDELVTAVMRIRRAKKCVTFQ